MSLVKKAIRQRFRDECFSRDSHRCKVCGNDEFLDAHHITDRSKMPNGGYVLENSITLCNNCHLKAEEHYESDNRYHHPGFHPDILYAYILSSKEEAIVASIKSQPALAG
tara:strand:- start:253 stop:582 length:330 start_codon:yes stop_codon:yes gene_type:complete